MRQKARVADLSIRKLMGEDEIAVARDRTCEATSPKSFVLKLKCWRRLVNVIVSHWASTMRHLVDLGITRHDVQQVLNHVVVKWY